MNHVFISYAREDYTYVKHLRNFLDKCEVEYWIDSTRIDAGDVWTNQIDDAIRGASAVIVVVTANSSASTYVIYEWALALGNGIRVIPAAFTYADTHPALYRLQQLDFRDLDAAPWDQLVSIIRKAQDSNRGHISNLQNELNSGNAQTRKDALNSLGRLSSPLVRPILIDALKHPELDVREGAAMVLGKGKDHAAISTLVEQLSRTPFEREVASTLMGLDGATVVQNIFSKFTIWNTYNYPPIEIVDHFSDGVVEMVLGLISSSDASPECRSNAVRFVARKKVLVAESALEAIVIDAGEPSFMRALSVAALTEIAASVEKRDSETDRLGTLLVETLEKEADSEIKKQCIIGLGLLKYKPASTRLQAFLNIEEFRWNALGALYHLGDSEADRIVERMARDGAPKERRRIRDLWPRRSKRYREGELPLLGADKLFRNVLWDQEFQRRWLPRLKV